MNSRRIGIDAHPMARVFPARGRDVLSLEGSGSAVNSGAAGRASLRCPFPSLRHHDVSIARNGISCQATEKDRTHAASVRCNVVFGPEGHVRRIGIGRKTGPKPTRRSVRVICFLGHAQRRSVPEPSRLSITSGPSWAAAMSWAIARPRPEPVDPAPFTNLSKT